MAVAKRSEIFVLQPEVKAVDEYGALIYVGRWGIHGVSLPGRVTFKPGNVGYVTFGAPRPLQVKYLLTFVLQGTYSERCPQTKP